MKNNVAIVRLWGGVGNQLFIYAFARLLQLKYNISVFLEARTGFANDGYKRICRLSDFNISLSAVNYYYTLFPYINRKHNFLKKIMFPGIFLFDEDINNLVTEISEDMLPSLNRSVYYQGYWQSLKFDDISEQLRKDFHFNVQYINNSFSFYKKKIEDSGKRSVAIHVRRMQYEPLLTLHYYQQAMIYISGIIENPSFFIFSDDIDWCKNNMDFKNREHCFVSNFSNELYELKLMSFCSHFIIANSTFSWWGAWMSSNEEKTVIMPEGYINNSMNGQVVFCKKG
jgi:hypothetical protein